MPLGHVSHGTLHVGDVRDIGSYCADCRAHLARKRGKPIRVPRNEHDLRSLLDEEARRREADTAAAARNDDHLISVFG